MLEWYKEQKFYGLISINLLFDVPTNKKRLFIAILCLLEKNKGD